MDRSQPKFLLTSLMGHALIFAVSLLGVAFFEGRKKEIDIPNIRIIPSQLIDELLAGGGGNPNVPVTDEAPAPAGGPTAPPTPIAPPPEVIPPTPTPTPPAPEPPAPEPTPVKPVVKQEPKPLVKPTPVKKPEPKLPKVVADKPKPADHDPKPIAELTKPVPKKPEIDIDPNKVVVRNKPDELVKKRKEKEESDRKAREETERKAYEDWSRQAKARQEGLAASIRNSSQNLGTGFASDKGVKIDVSGPGGAPYANYSAFVKQAYDRAWRLSPSLGSDDVTTEISVTVLRSGEILNARISKRSGLPALDKSVETAIAGVPKLPKFPDTTTDEQRTFTIRFNLKAKNSSG